MSVENKNEVNFDLRENKNEVNFDLRENKQKSVQSTQPAKSLGSKGVEVKDQDPELFELTSVTDFNTDGTGEVSEQLSPCTLLSSSLPDDFLKAAMEGKLDTQVLRQQLKMSEEDIAALVKDFSEFSMSVDLGLIKDIPEDVFVCKESTWEVLVGMLRTAPRCQDDQKFVELTCNSIECNNKVRFSDAKVEELQSLQSANPCDFLCDECNTFFQ